jgi:hypothetical protein
MMPAWFDSAFMCFNLPSDNFIPMLLLIRGSLHYAMESTG